MRAARNSLLVLLLGLALGVLSKWSDFYSPVLAALTSGVQLWVFLSCAAALGSRTPGRAALHVFLLLGGMVCAYYAAAVRMGGVWGRNFAIGWGIAAVLSVIPGWMVWFARGRSVRAWVLRLGVLGFQALAMFALSGGVNALDAAVITATAGLLLRGAAGRKYVSGHGFFEKR